MRADTFRSGVTRALHDARLQKALGNIESGFVMKRARAVAALPEWDRLRAEARAIRNHTLDHLDHYLRRFEQAAVEAGGQVHWAADAAAATAAVLQICRTAGARRVVKGKSMVTEEIGLNAVLAAEGLEVTETDLGEYIIQLAGEPPSHIIAPAIHKTRADIAGLFRRAHHTEPREEIGALVDEARRVLRQRYIEADVGITGANFLVAETGSALIVTNEGNGDLCNSLPRVHIVVAGIEKLVPRLGDTTPLLRLLGRSATGQSMTSYTTLSTGPRRDGEADGPREYHVVLVDNGRSAMLGGEFRDMLRCIRCGACLNHCPVYTAVGGHAYGWVYPGPMGAVLTPLLLGLEHGRDLPNACTLNGRCRQVCPMDIPLPEMLRALRRRQHDSGLDGRLGRVLLKWWAFVAQRPALYRRLTALEAGLLRRVAGRRGVFHAMPLAGAWTRYRDLPVPSGETFMQAWRKRRSSRNE